MENQKLKEFKIINLHSNETNKVKYSNYIDLNIDHTSDEFEEIYIGEMIELLVNTSDPYDGIVPIDFINSQKTSRFEVSAFGQWSIEILPLSQSRRITVPGVIKGNGDEIIVLTGGNADTAHIVGNQADKLFSVRAYGENGIDTLINTTDPYEGTISLENGIFLLEIKAVGEWTIEIDE